MTIHQVKSWPEYFEPLRIGRRTFELRRNDRDYMDGDLLLISEWDPATDEYTGREITKRIAYVMRGAGSVAGSPPTRGLALGFAILGLEDAT